MQYFFYIFLIFFFILDFFFYCRKRKKVFGFHQIIFITLILILNLYQIINNEINLRHKVDLIFLSLFFLFSSYFAYLNIITFLNRSGSFLILISYFQRKQNNIVINDIFKIDLRFEEIKKAGLIKYENDKFLLTNKGLFFLKLYQFFIKLLNIKTIG